ncbi:MAG TPA: asparagine synthase (glutamine-hydrolyzing) [Candidatus Limnocylindria bacterium]
MCGIAGIMSLSGAPVPELEGRLDVMNALLSHRGPDGWATWQHPSGQAGFMHRRLAIIDLTTGDQPMEGRNGDWITANHEIYNYIEVRDELGADSFRTTSDTEVILRAYEQWGPDCLPHLRGMFAFALWDAERGALFCARDRFGMKPFYYAVVDGHFLFASEAKALLPFLPAVETDLDGMRDYLTFQFCLDGKTLFKGIRELPAGHSLTVANGEVRIQRYWDVNFVPDYGHSSTYFEEELQARMEDSIRVHLRADVPVGAYLSGGLDSSIVAAMAADSGERGMMAFHGRFPIGAQYDESDYAQALADDRGLDLRISDINVDDFVREIERVIYHLDYPVAGPGAFPQYIVSRSAREHRKVVLGGQGGDELFGGYARYLVAYLEQCLKAAIDGTLNNGNFVVSYESILPNLPTLYRYKPMLQEFWAEGLFEPMDRRYFRLVSRGNAHRDEIRWDQLGTYSPYETFRSIYYADNIEGESYFDRMTHFDFKTLLPALLQVEDRMSMAHGLESRLPFLDHPIVELAATIPADIKFEGGRLKRLLVAAFGPRLPRQVRNRTDKMGFPTPLTEWAQGPAREFITDILSSQAALDRSLIDNRAVLASLDEEAAFGRGFWGLLSLELWQRQYHDRSHEFQAMRTELRRAV